MPEKLLDRLLGELPEELPAVLLEPLSPLLLTNAGDRPEIAVVVEVPTDGGAERSWNQNLSANRWLRANQSKSLHWLPEAPAPPDVLRLPVVPWPEEAQRRACWWMSRE